MTLEGVLVLDKPAGMTSHDVVDEVRRILKVKRVGHAGTLDPDATGVLVVGVGRATRLLQFAQERPKRYRAGARFGVATSTQDASGAPLAFRDASHLDAPTISSAALGFTGAIMQTPPMVSAVKVGGERLYKKALRGEEVERTARPVAVYRFELLAFDPGDEPGAAFDVECSSGTYVRTLIHDLGEALGCGAHMVSLRRTATAGFTLDDAIGIEDVAADRLRPLLDLVSFMPRIQLDPEQARLVGHGRALDPARVAGAADLREGESVALVGPRGDLLAVYVRRGSDLAPERVLAG